MYVYICIYIYISICMYVCIYMYMYMCWGLFLVALTSSEGNSLSLSIYIYIYIYFTESAEGVECCDQTKSDRRRGLNREDATLALEMAEQWDASSPGCDALGGTGEPPGRSLYTDQRDSSESNKTPTVKKASRREIRSGQNKLTVPPPKGGSENGDLENRFLSSD